MAGMGNLGRESADRTDTQLAQREAELIMATSIDLESLRPQVSDPQALELLIQAVNESTERNESIAQFQERVSSLGEAVMRVAGEVKSLI
jgi:hypothetical protein